MKHLESITARRLTRTVLALLASSAVLTATAGCDRGQNAERETASTAESQAQSSDPASLDNRGTLQSAGSQGPDTQSGTSSMGGTEGADVDTSTTDSDFATSSGATSPTEPSAESSQTTREPASTEAQPTATATPAAKKKGAKSGAQTGGTHSHSTAAGETSAMATSEKNVKKGTAKSPTTGTAGTSGTGQASADPTYGGTTGTTKDTASPNQGQSSGTTQKKTEGDAKASGSAVRSGGASNRNMSQLENPDAEYSGTSEGLRDQASIGAATGVPANEIEESERQIQMEQQQAQQRQQEQQRQAQEQIQQQQRQAEVASEPISPDVDPNLGDVPAEDPAVMDEELLGEEERAPADDSGAIVEVVPAPTEDTTGMTAEERAPASAGAQAPSAQPQAPQAQPPAPQEAEIEENRAGDLTDWNYKKRPLSQATPRSQQQDEGRAPASAMSQEGARPGLNPEETAPLETTLASPSTLEEEERLAREEELKREAASRAAAAAQAPTQGPALESSGTSTSAVNTEVSSVKVDWAKDNPVALSGPDLSTEPTSRMPAHVGSVQITGKDKSIAVLEDTHPFTDPNALARNERAKEAVQPINEVDFGAFSHERRREFQSAMQSRLANLDRRVDVFRAQAIEDTKYSRPQLRDQLDQVDGRISALEERTDIADAVQAEQWDQYRSQFREQLTQLESQMAQLNVALR